MITERTILSQYLMRSWIVHTSIHNCPSVNTIAHKLQRSGITRAGFLYPSAFLQSRWISWNLLLWKHRNWFVIFRAWLEKSTERKSRKYLKQGQLYMNNRQWPLANTMFLLNLLGIIMIQILPHNRIKWMNQRDSDSKI